jgi:hypothetical protein
VPRPSVLAAAASLAVILIAGSSQRLVGDGREYLAQAINFASLHGPALRPAHIDDIQAEMSRVDPSLAAWDIREATVADSHRNRDFQHFWFYALLATPGLWITRLLHVAPTFAFTGLNLVLLGIALWVVLPRIGGAASLLLFASPVLWWIDKVHTEVFTFALLIIVFAALEERPWWSMIAAGAAATQNPPIAAVVFLVWIVAVLHDRAAISDRRVVGGAAVGVLFALLHPMYMLVHHHTPSLLLTATRSGAPTFASLSAVVADPTVGLVGNFPVLLVVVAVAVITLVFGARAKADDTGARGLVTRGIAVAGAAAAVFLLSFSRTTNVHHGGTPGLSRYSVWLIPLAVPLLARTEQLGGRRWRWFLRASALASSLISIIAFRPSVPENSREPTLLATFFWTRLPAWNNPLPEVFSETELHVDDLWVPASTRGCEKILLGGGEAGWPVPCYPAVVPSACQGELCYANLVNGRYAFTRAPGGGVGKLRTEAVWPVEAVPHVRRIYDAWDWRTLNAGAGDLGVVREAVGVSVVPVGSSDRFILILRDVRPAAVVRLRVGHQIRGVLIDVMTGRTLAAEVCDAGETCAIDVPAGSRILLLAMR